ncbi:MAG: sorbosone dehydrogenase family protein [Patescibacteria group bacterium]
MNQTTQTKMKWVRSRFTLIIALVLLGLFVWFIFGWLVGPRPAWNTLPNLVQSYFRNNSKLSKDIELLPATGDLNYLRLPPNFQIKIFASELGGPNLYIPGVNGGVRQVVVKNGVVYATIHKTGQVVALFDRDQNSLAEDSKVFLENLSLPHGIDTYQNWIYVGENDKIIRVQDSNSDGVADGPVEKLVDLPPLLEHWTRTVHIFPDPNEPDNSDPKMFITVGSSCSACIESNPWRAVMLKCETDGKNCQVYARGLRNSVDFVSYQNKIYATDTGKDLVANDFPPDELNIIQSGKDYGWPYCYGKQIHDTTFDALKNPCPQTQPSLAELTPHSTPLGIDGYTGNNFPGDYKNSLFITLHGSYHSKPPSGYKVVRVDPATGQVTDFITNFIDGNGIHGRPVDVINYRDGLLITDDKAGKIYYIDYQV